MFDAGPVITPASSLVCNDTDRPERVFSQAQFEALRRDQSKED